MSSDEAFIDRAERVLPNIKRKTIKGLFQRYAEDHPEGDPLRYNLKMFCEFVIPPSNDIFASKKDDEPVAHSWNIEGSKPEEPMVLNIGFSKPEPEAQPTTTIDKFESELADELVDEFDDGAEEVAQGVVGEALVMLGFDKNTTLDQIMRPSGDVLDMPKKTVTTAQNIVKYYLSGALQKDIYKGLVDGMRKGFNKVVKPKDDRSSILKDLASLRDTRMVSTFFDVVHGSLKVGNYGHFTPTSQPYYAQTSPSYYVPYAYGQYGSYYGQPNVYNPYPTYPTYQGSQDYQQPQKPLQRTNNDLDTNTLYGGGVSGAAGDISGNVVRAGGDAFGQVASDLTPVVTDAVASAAQKGTALAVDYGGRAARSAGRAAAKQGKATVRSLLESLKNYNSGSGKSNYSTALKSLPVNAAFPTNQEKSGVFRVKDSLVSAAKDGVAGAKRNVKGLAGMLLGTPETSSTYNPKGTITTQVGDIVEKQVTDSDSSLGKVIDYSLDKTPEVAGQGVQIVGRAGEIVIGVVNGVLTAIAYSAPNPMQKGSFRAAISSSFDDPEFESVAFGNKGRFSNSVFDFEGPNPAMIAAKHMWRNGYSDVSDENYSNVFNTLPIGVILPSSSSIKKDMSSFSGNDSVKKFVRETARLSKEAANGTIKGVVVNGKIERRAIEEMATVVVSVAMGASKDVRNGDDAWMHVAMQVALVKLFTEFIQRVSLVVSVSSREGGALAEESNAFLKLFGLFSRSTLDDNEYMDSDERKLMYRKAVDDEYDGMVESYAPRRSTFGGMLIDAKHFKDLPSYDAKSVDENYRKTKSKARERTPASTMMRSKSVSGAFGKFSTPSNLYERAHQLGCLMHATAVTIANSKSDMIDPLVEAMIRFTTEGDGSDTTSLRVLVLFAGYCVLHIVKKSSGSVKYHIARTIKKSMSSSAVNDTIRKLISNRMGSATLESSRPQPRMIEASQSRPAQDPIFDFEPTKPERTAEERTLERFTRRFPGTTYLVGDQPVEQMFTSNGFARTPAVEDSILRESPDGKTLTSLKNHRYNVRGNFIGIQKSHPLYKNKETVGYNSREIHKNSNGQVKRLYLDH